MAQFTQTPAPGPENITTNDPTGLTEKCKNEAARLRACADLLIAASECFEKGLVEKGYKYLAAAAKTVEKKT